MTILKYNDCKKEDFAALKGNVIFLAGPTVRAHQTHLLPSWRVEAIEYFIKYNFEGTLIVPEFDNIIDNPESRTDIPIWEYYGTKRADTILFWIPRTEELIGLTTNWELGFNMGRNLHKISLGFPENSYRNNYIKTMWELIVNDTIGTYYSISYNLEQLVLKSIRHNNYFVNADYIN